MKRVLLISDNKPGHYNQSLGIIELLKQAYPEGVEVETIHARLRFKILRKYLKYSLNHKRFPALRFLSWFYRLTLPAAKPDIILATGGDLSFLTAWLGHIYNCQTIFSGSLRKLDASLFTLIFTMTDFFIPNQIVMEVAPHIAVDHKEAAQRRALFLEERRLPEQAYWALLVGGNGVGYSYHKDDHESLIQAVSTLAQKYNIRWLITTSRRTSPDLERAIEALPPEIAAYRVIYSKDPEKIMAKFLATADVICVTEESSSMIAEAVAARKPVYSLYPRRLYFQHKYQKLLQQFLDHRRLCRVPISTLESLPRDYAFEYIPEDYRAVLVEKLRGMLQTS